ncbi:MAG TPA: phosphatidylserine/phosphatidylglycerophosphate/cardiolipin synthase family protein [Candidatus Dormibacteraeota bacterium]|nr:phosphatidylserine/phosphatidylglycerophosphate/cardiolipin synthase family protein [Candidatus Dormibacteraeota bacterium]
MIGRLASELDTRAGEALEAASRARHRRRLARIGFAHVFEGSGHGWAAGPPPPREGNHVDVHIDGEEALPAIVEAIRGARSFVHIAGWTVDPDFAMEREPALVTVRELLSRAAESVDVRVLTWAGAPVPVMHPTRRDASRLMSELVQGTRIRGALDKRNRPMHCHHEKLVIVDGTVAFVGGIDLTDWSGDRYDMAPHPGGPALGWHDALARITGPTVADVAAHLALRWEATTGERLPGVAVPPPAGTSRVQLVRTVPERTYTALPRGAFSVLEAYLGAFRSARRFIYIENQFLWSTEVVAVLADVLRHPPSDDFRLCVVLPMRPNNGNEDTRGQLAVLIAADHHRRLLVGTIGPPGPNRPPVYVHAKVSVVDDHWLTVGSTNLNEHSLFNDTEVNVVTDDPAVATDVRERLWSEHLAQDCSGRDPIEVLETLWRPALEESPPHTRPLRGLPAISRRSARLKGPLNGLLVDA